MFNECEVGKSIKLPNGNSVDAYHLLWSLLYLFGWIHWERTKSESIS